MNNTLKKISVSLICSTMLSFSASLYAQTVSKFRVSVAELSVNDSISAKNEKIIKESKLINAIENAIRNGRKFELVSRRSDVMKEVLKEQQFARSGYAAGDAAASGQLSNAQAVVVVKVDRFSFGRNAQKIPNIDGKYRVSVHASLALTVQIVDTSKGVVTASFPVKAQAGSSVQISNGVGSASPAILDKAIDSAAGSLANQLSDTVFPIKVISVKGKRLWVNRGNDSGIKLGEQFVIFEPGEVLVDPETGENLGSAETEVGLAKVVRINPKVTVLEVIKGDADLMDKGFILRREQK